MDLKTLRDKKSVFWIKIGGDLAVSATEKYKIRVKGYRSTNAEFIRVKVNNSNVIQFENGRAVITFSIATNSYYTNNAGEQVQNTTWHECKKFVRNVNEKLVEKLVKGVAVTIMGTLQYEEYEKPVTKTKAAKIKKAYIEVVGLEIA